MPAKDDDWEAELAAELGDSGALGKKKSTGSKPVQAPKKADSKAMTISPSVSATLTLSGELTGDEGSVSFTEDDEPSLATAPQPAKAISTAASVKSSEFRCGKVACHVRSISFGTCTLQAMSKQHKTHPASPSYKSSSLTGQPQLLHQMPAPQVCSVECHPGRAQQILKQCHLHQQNPQLQSALGPAILCQVTAA
jgi:hypothetical protein